MPRSIAETVSELRAQGRKALVAYVTAGDPDLQFTHDIILELEKVGVDIVELGVPFGHPVGDGPSIQRSVKRALDNGVSLTDILAMVRQLRQTGATLPIVLFSYHNPVFSYGYETLAKEAANVGVSAVLLVDLPPEESGEYCASLNSAGIDTVFLATPTTTTERLPLVGAAASGFCYYVSRAGVTGGNQDLSISLASELVQLKEFVKIPVFVGFGIRTAEHVRIVAKIADGVIIGSAFVDCIEEATSEEEAKEQVVALATTLRQALDESGC
jgi:tryptophan synthase alpha chain